MNERSKLTVAFCIGGFLITALAGLGMFLAPGYFSNLIGIAVPSEFNPYFIKLLGLILIAIGLCYFMAIYDEDASRSLIFVASGEKVLAVIYSLGAFIRGNVNAKILGVVIVDGILAIIGLYIAISLSRVLWTEDDMNENK